MHRWAMVGCISCSAILALLPVARAGDWAVVGGVCYKDVGLETAGSTPADWTEPSPSTDAAGCRQQCDEKADSESDRCYGFQVDEPFTQCRLFKTPVLGSNAFQDPSDGKQCKIPFGSVIALQMQFSGINTLMGSVGVVDTKIEELIRKRIADSQGVQEDHVSVHSQISKSYIRGHFVLPVNTDPAPVLADMQTSGYWFEQQMARDNAINLAITIPGKTWSMAKYDAWIWGNKTAEIENDADEATRAFSLPSYLLAVVAMLVCSTVIVV